MVKAAAECDAGLERGCDANVPPVDDVSSRVAAPDGNPFVQAPNDASDPGEDSEN